MNFTYDSSASGAAPDGGQAIKRERMGIQGRPYRGRRVRRREPEECVFAVCLLAALLSLGLMLRTVATVTPEPARKAQNCISPRTTEPLDPEPPLHVLGPCRITHYCACAACCGKWADGVTATGAVPEEGVTVAVDPSVIPLGSTVYIDGQAYLAEDTGVRGAAVDVFVADHQRALELGVRTAEVAWEGGAA